MLVDTSQLITIQQIGKLFLDESYVYLDSPLWGEGQPKTRYTMFVLPHGKVLQNVSVRCPEGAQVALLQVGQPVRHANCIGQFTLLETGWTAPLASNIVSLWIDVSATGANLNDVWLDDITYSD
jgi:hypothetical protein